MERKIKPVFWTVRTVKDLEKITRFNIQLYGFKKALPQMQRLSRHEQIDVIPIHKDVFFNILNKIKELSYENDDLKEAMQNLKKQSDI